MNGGIAEVKRLIDSGADVNAKDKDGWTALHSAAEQGQTAIAAALIKARVDIHAKDKWDLTPLHTAAQFGQTETVLALIKAKAYQCKSRRWLDTFALCGSGRSNQKCACSYQSRSGLAYP